MHNHLDRNLIGYGANPPDPQWPGGARIAVNINLNFEGGGERSVMDGDGVSEGVLNDIGFPAYFGVRSPIVETVFEYGPRVGVWRLLRIFKEFDVKVSILGVVRGMQQCPEAVQAFLDLNARWMAPMHYGSFRLSQEPMDEPLRLLAHEARQRNVSDRVIVLEEGVTRFF